MAENTKIEWAHHTFNPWIGCTKVSAACDNCYAEARSNRFGDVEWGAGKPRRRTSEANWRKPVLWNRKAEELRIRQRVFCASLADVFDAEVSDLWRADLFNLIYRTTSLDWLLLTKRPDVARRHFQRHEWPENIWIGTTVEDTDMLELRWPKICRIPRIRFLSCEPLLAQINLMNIVGLPAPDWIICGGESGPNARHMQPHWAQSLKYQCQQQGIAFLMKQMSGKTKRELEAIPPELLLREYPV